MDVIDVKNYEIKEEGRDFWYKEICWDVYVIELNIDR